MADVTWGVKVPEELKDQINRLMKESGLQGRDFMQQIINAYIVEIAKDEAPEIAQDLEELQSLTQRINDIYLNMSHRIENLYEGERRNTAQLLEEKDKIITEVHEELDISKDKYENLVKLYNEKNNNINELTKDIGRLTENTEHLKALNEEYKKNISNLREELQSTRDTIEEIDKLREENAAATEKIQDLTAKLHQREELVQKAKEQIQQLESGHRVDLEALRRNFEIERAKLTLDLEREHLEQIERLKENYEEALGRQELREENIKANYDRRINELMGMYRDLSLQILVPKEEESKTENSD